jgi:hypothetical protein
LTEQAFFSSAKRKRHAQEVHASFDVDTQKTCISVGTQVLGKVEWVGFCVSVSVGRVAFIRYGCPADGTLMTLSDITFCRRDLLYSVLFAVINRSKIRETDVKLNDGKSLSG